MSNTTKIIIGLVVALALIAGCLAGLFMFGIFGSSPDDSGGAVAPPIATVPPLATPTLAPSFITITKPATGAIVDISRAVTVSGRGGGLPEGNVVVQALDRDGNVLAQQPTIIDAGDAGTGGEGPWTVDLIIQTEPGMAGKIRAFSPSPADNSVIAEAVVEVSFGQTAAKPSFIQINNPLQGTILDINKLVDAGGIGGGLPEGNVVVQALASNGAVIAQTATTIDAQDAGAGGQGPWSTQLKINTAPGTTGQIRAFSPSPADNSVIAEARVDVTFGLPPSEVPPVAVIQGPSEAFVGRQVTFQGGNSTPGSSPIVVYAWDFGTAGARSQSADVSATTVYNEPGVFTVRLTVTDQNGLSNTATMQITVKEEPGEDLPPAAVISAPGEAQVGQTVTFDASASQAEGRIVSYAWDLGDGTQANAITIQHVYNSPAVYNVILTVTDDKDLSDTTNVQINITAPKPTAEPTPEPTEVPTPEPTEEPGNIEGVDWVLNGTIAGTEITALFEGGTVSGSSGCNTYSASYQLNGNNITVSPATGSQIMCEEDIMQQEARYLTALAGADSYQVTPDQLRITGVEAMVFTAR